MAQPLNWIKMRKNLKDIAEIRSGYTFRGAIPEAGEGDYHVLQIRDVRNNSSISVKDLPFIQAADIKQAVTLQAGDVVIPARGEYNQAVMFTVTDNNEKPVIPSNQLFVLRVKQDRVEPGFLCWFLNQREAQDYLKSEMRGTNMPFISRESLSHLSVPVPPVQVQKKIVHMLALWEREKDRTAQLLQNREAQLKGAFRQLMEQSQHD